MSNPETIDFFAIVERHHTFQNPTSEKKLGRLIEYCGVKDGSRVLDVGCGKAWLLRRMAARYSIDGVGIELRSDFVNEGRDQIRRTPGNGSVTLHQMSAGDYTVEPHNFDIGLCIGASFAIGSFEDMLTWLKPQIKPGGCLAIGDIYAKRSNLLAESLKHFSGGIVRTIGRTVEILKDHGLELIGLIDSSQEEWDEYESLHWLAADEWLRTHPDHPEFKKFQEWSKIPKDAYLKADRDGLGWAMFVCRVL